MNPKFNPDTLLPETISAVLAALIYDEENFALNVYRLFGFRVHAFTDLTQRYYYAAVVDEERNRLFIVFRGTDGRNGWGRFLSWATINLRVKTTPQGFHEGFWSIAADASKNIAQYVKKATQVYLACHSQGSGVGVCEIDIICQAMLSDQELLPHLKHLQADLWCSPPAVNATGKTEIDGYIQGGLVSINNWWMPGDLISKKNNYQEKDAGDFHFHGSHIIFTVSNYH